MPFSGNSYRIVPPFRDAFFALPPTPSSPFRRQQLRPAGDDRSDDQQLTRDSPP
jgi:hypothetical protein